MLSYFSLYLSLNLVNLCLTTPAGMGGPLSTGMSGRFGLESVTGLTGIRNSIHYGITRRRIVLRELTQPTNEDTEKYKYDQH